MLKKINLIAICGIILLCLSGCGNNLKNEIAGNTFVYKIEDDESSYGTVTSSETLTFDKDGKVTVDVDIDFTGSLKEYVDKNTSDDSRHTSEDYTYTINEEDNIVSFETDDDTYNLKYDKDTECLIDSEKESIKYCKE